MRFREPFITKVPLYSNMENLVLRARVLYFFTVRNIIKWQKIKKK